MFKINQSVVWNSQASGTSKTKSGTIIAVVPPNTSLLSLGFKSLASKSGGARDHESYVVFSDGKQYWPVVSKLVRFANLLTPNPARTSTPKSPVTGTTVKIGKTLVGFSLDFSGSMSNITKNACDDYNSSIKSLNEESIKNKQDTVITTIKCGVGSGRNEFLYTNKRAHNIDTMPYQDYRATGNTPLWDSIQELIESLEAYKEKDDAVLVMVITDGEENGSKRATASSISKEIRRLQATDQWSFTFRVPYGYKRNLVNLGISENNIVEWEQTSAGFANATQINSNAIGSYMTMRSYGQSSTQSFYANLNASDNTIKNTLIDISKDIRILPVTKDVPIRDFITYHGENFSKGGAFYQLTKTEDIVQDYKEILVQDKRDGKIYGGRDSRDLLQLPHSGNIKLKPGKTGFYDVFVQSTSVNRKLLSGTKCLYKTN